MHYVSTLNQDLTWVRRMLPSIRGMGPAIEEYRLIGRIARPNEASGVGSHVKSPQSGYLAGEVAQKSPEPWLSSAGTMAHFAPDYSIYLKTA